ncbi:MAG: undecaprenyl-diphosphate phosphatase [Pseudomonadales bacterium]
MDYLQIIILALIQGITEFLPISSSAHLILPAQLLGWEDQGLAFDIAVHVGSLGAVLLYFRRDLTGMVSGGAAALLRGERDERASELLKIVAATLPVVVCGFLARDWVETGLRNLLVIAATTIAFGLLLGYADTRHGERIRVTWNDALVIGTLQVLALVPGTSRSGITITAALLLGLSRVSAARFSFLLSIPTIAGAGLLAALSLLEGDEPVQWGVLASGAVLSGVAAYSCISAFIALVERTGMLPYVIYRLALGSALIVLWFALAPAP